MDIKLLAAAKKTATLHHDAPVKHPKQYALQSAMEGEEKQTLYQTYNRKLTYMPIKTLTICQPRKTLPPQPKFYLDQWDPQCSQSSCGK